MRKWKRCNRFHYDSETKKRVWRRQTHSLTLEFLTRSPQKDENKRSTLLRPFRRHARPSPEGLGLARDVLPVVSLSIQLSLSISSALR